MREDYHSEKTAALFKEARDLTAGLKIEIGKIAAQMSRIPYDDDEDMAALEVVTKCTVSGQAPAPTPARKSFWQRWR